MNIHILLGVTGDLARKKVIPALFELSKSRDIHFIGLGRKLLPPPEFSMLDQHIYLHGDMQNKKIYTDLKSSMEKKIGDKKSEKKLVCTIYSALPPNMHMPIIESILNYTIEPLKKAVLKKNRISLDLQILIEKPLGTNFNDAKYILQKIKGHSTETKFYFVDHYLAKEPLIDIQNLSNTNPKILAPIVYPPKLKEVDIHLYETHGIDGRGSFYDAVGALQDVGQNHLMQVLARIIQVQIKSLSLVKGKQIPSVTNILNSLAIQGKMLFGQYQGYQQVESVRPGSKTETFFRVSFNVVGVLQRKFPFLQGIKYTISSGKNVSKQESGISFIAQNDASFLDLSKGTHDAYYKLFDAVFYKDQSLFADPDSILASWKIIERINKLKTKSELIVYTQARDIIS